MSRDFIITTFRYIFVVENFVQFVGKTCVIIACINGLQSLAVMLLTDGPVAPLSERLLVNTFVGLPFIFGGMILTTHLTNLQTTLANLAITDMLTGLPNRRGFLTESANAHLTSGAGVLMILDADFFKRINDAHGHAAGDACLVAIAERLRDVAAPIGPIGRLGGEEFAAYFPALDMDSLRALAQSLTASIPLPETADTATTGPIAVTLSLGATQLRRSDSIELGLQRADKALYLAKSRGRARLEVWGDQPLVEVA